MFATRRRPGPAPNDVLLVEDEALIAMLLEDYFRDMGIGNVTVASTLADGLQAARTGRFDLAVLDVNLRGERSDGIAAVLVERGIPFLFSTGYGRVGVSDLYSDCPVLTKPVRFADLRAMVDRLLA